MNTLEKGLVLEGVVKAISDFGVFVDLGGIDGLVHITDLSWGRVNHPTEVVSEDITVRVVVLEFNKAQQHSYLHLLLTIGTNHIP
jgi:small subunit ribosomal protein S1